MTITPEAESGKGILQLLNENAWKPKKGF